MWNDILNSLNVEQLLQNQFFTGAFAAGLIGAIALKGQAILRWIWARIYRTFATSIELNSQNSKSYQPFVDWIFSQKSFQNLKTLSQVNSDGEWGEELSEQEKKERRLALSPANGFYFGRIGWRPVGLWCWSQTSTQNGAKTYYVVCITFGFSNKFFKRVLLELADKDSDTTIVYQGSQRHNMTRKGKRQLSTIYLQDEIVQDIVKDIDAFHKNKEEYRRRGIPWKRNYLLYGPPGTGKSSLVLGLAGYSNRDIVMINSNSDDSHIIYSYQSSKNHMIVFEDIDGMEINLTREDKTKGVCLSTILNCLDGLNSAEGSISIITTNNIEKLDPAILRAGRIDKKYELKYFDFDFACKVCMDFCGMTGPVAEKHIEEWFDKKEGRYISPAQLQEKMYEKMFL